ncbi:hypothetical protein Q4574_09650 [Aliiglaciecola sp. 3_MG-2023]|uniref:hypothetical protein n=1 Tax=Aliiglaciecola sp. 3_MG-2023 TaxID=3062644 RepID=UPI0026E21747|nr:hypothetical protein [Aliiglaciecola sp. 3_MG-2023]MDO6693548.1 hypothetical protein [Aliiglaciecola sp. 3_MG-2023]
MGQIIIAIWVVNLALADFFINVWISDASRYIGKNLIFAEWYGIGSFFMSISRTMESFGADFTVSFILTLMTIVMMGSKTLDDIDNEIN